MLNLTYSPSSLVFSILRVPPKCKMSFVFSIQLAQSQCQRLSGPTSSATPLLQRSEKHQAKLELNAGQEIL